MRPWRSPYAHMARGGLSEQTTTECYAWRRKLGLGVPRRAKIPIKNTPRRAFQQLVFSQGSAAVSARLPGDILVEVAAGQKAALVRGGAASP